MMNADEKLAATLVWEPDGHLTETALNALADGEGALLPDPAVTHAAGCHRCEERLESTALLAIEIASALAAPPPQPHAEAAHARRPLPVPAFLGALAIVAAGLVSEVSGMAAKWMRLATLIAHAVPVLARGIALAVGGASGSAGFAAAGCAAAALLMLGGVMVARFAPASGRVKEPA